MSSEAPEEAIRDLYANLDLSHIESKILSLTTLSDRRFIILMDHLDEGYEPDDTGIGIITGLVYASIELNKRAEKNVACCIQNACLFKIDQEKDQRISNRCTAGNLQGRDGFRQCLQFTGSGTNSL